MSERPNAAVHHAGECDDNSATPEQPVYGENAVIHQLGLQGGEMEPSAGYPSC